MEPILSPSGGSCALTTLKPIEAARAKMVLNRIVVEVPLAIELRGGNWWQKLARWWCCRYFSEIAK